MVFGLGGTQDLVVDWDKREQLWLSGVGWDVLEAVGFLWRWGSGSVVEGEYSECEFGKDLSGLKQRQRFLRGAV